MAVFADPVIHMNCTYVYVYHATLYWPCNEYNHCVTAVNSSDSVCVCGGDSDSKIVLAHARQPKQLQANAYYSVTTF